MSRYPFVGRERETAQVRGELEAGRSVVLTGISGIGRTALAHHVADAMAAETSFVFVDINEGPGEVWRKLFAAIFPEARSCRGGQEASTKWMRFRVSSARPDGPRRHVVMLDNLARLSPQRLDVLRRLRARYSVLAIAEDFLPEAAKIGVCTALWARPPLRLGHLSRAATVDYFDECSRRWELGWGRGEIVGLATATGGFPLGMRQAVAAELRRNGIVGSHARLSPGGR